MSNLSEERKAIVAYLKRCAEDCMNRADSSYDVLLDVYTDIEALHPDTCPTPVTGFAPIKCEVAKSYWCSCRASVDKAGVVTWTYMDNSRGVKQSLKQVSLTCPHVYGVEP